MHSCSLSSLTHSHKYTNTHTHTHTHTHTLTHTVTRRRTLFSDPGNEIQELTQVIKQDLAKLNSDIADLQQQVKSKSGRENRHVRTHSSSVVVSLQVYTCTLDTVGSG